MKPNKEYLEELKVIDKFLDLLEVSTVIDARRDGRVICIKNDDGGRYCVDFDALALEEKDREWEKQIETVIEQEAEFINLNGMEVTVIELAKLRKALGIKAAKQQ